MSGRQRSFRERLHGIGLSWHLKSHQPHPVEIQPACRADSPDPTPPSDKENKSPDKTEKKPLTRSLTQPKNTVEYVVQKTDTLSGIAARFETTPSELTNLNRLASRMVFPGQVIYVPSRNSRTPKEPLVEQPPPQAKQPQDPEPTSTAAQQKPRFLKLNSRYFTDGLGVVSGVLIITPNAFMFDPNVSDPLVLEHGTEAYGVVAPMDMVVKAAMYNDLAHMRVKHAADQQYQFPKPQIYHAYRPKSPSKEGGEESPAKPEEQRTLGTNQAQPACVEVRLPDDEEERGSSKATSLLSSDDRVPSIPPRKEADATQTAVSEPDPDHKEDFPLLTTHAELPSLTDQNVPKSTSSPINVSPPASDGKPQSRSPEAPQQERPTSIEVPSSSPPKRASTVKLRSSADKSSRKQSSSQEEGKPDGLPSAGSLDRAHESSREKMFKRLSYPVESLSKILVSSPKTIVDFSSGLFVKSTEEASEGKEEVLPPAPTSAPLLGYKNMVEEKQDLFESLDKIIHMKPRRSIHEEPPLFLCLRMGKPISDESKWSGLGLQGRKRIRPEYWFSIPFLRAEEVYNFLHRFQPRVYGETDVDPESLGFLPLEDWEEEEEKVAPKEEDSGIQEGLRMVQTDGGGDQHIKPASSPLRIASPLSLLRMMEDSLGGLSMSANEWEVLSLADTERSLSIDLSDLPLPELLSTSEVLVPEHRKELCQHLPARAIGYSWSLVYSTSLHGFSLNSLYRRMALYDTPILLAIRDTSGTIFGAVSSSSLRISEKFYGTGESFLYTFHEGFKCYHWTGENLYFVKGNPNSLVFGAGEGDFGLYLDGDLYHGRTCRCQTYGNEPLTPEGDFVIATLEAWGFV